MVASWLLAPKLVFFASSTLMVTTTDTAMRKPTLRSLSSTLSAASSLSKRSQEMNDRVGSPLTDNEVQEVINSLKNLMPVSDKEGSTNEIEWKGLESLLLEVAHLSHKDWARTGDNAKRLGDILFPKGITEQSSARQLLERVLLEGNWDGAAEHGKSQEEPWAVLVTGVNGIRKTTSIYQKWFPQLLEEALVSPESASSAPSLDILPCGSNSFFRQLDHMICTLCNEDFATMYALTADLLGSDLENEPSKEVVQQYSDLKAAIFTRYRTLSELLGAYLLTEAQTLRSNCMMETSGRDVAMFHYVDHFFPKDTSYRKLALHFTINEISHAMSSVDERMVREIKAGTQALQSESAFDVVYSNAGGPYGSEVLKSVQADSDRVWNDVVLKNEGVGGDWYKATIQINAHATRPWTAQAVKPDGSLGTKFTFRR